MVRRKQNKILVYISAKDDKENLEMVINSDITWGLNKGVFALMAMGTPVTFTKLRVLTNDDFESSMSLDEGDLNAQKVGAEAMASATAMKMDDDKKKKKRNKKKKKKKGAEAGDLEEDEPDEANELTGSKPGGEKKVTTCLDYHQKKLKLNFCQLKYGREDKDSIRWCMDNYCESCCSDLHPSDL